MAKLKGLILEKSEISQTISLSDVFGVDVPQKIARQLGERLVDYMTNRTLGGVDVSGNDFKEYSEPYAKEKGVGRGDVNMWLRGDMLPSIKQTAKSDGTLKIEMTGRVNKLKAYNHNTGDTVPQRQFFGVKMDEIRAIAKEIKAENPDIFKKKEPTQTAREILEAVEALGGEPA